MGSEASASLDEVNCASSNFNHKKCPPLATARQFPPLDINPKKSSLIFDIRRCLTGGITTWQRRSLLTVFRKHSEVLKQIAIDGQAGAFVSLLGQSGCGKSTLLRMFAGFEAQGPRHCFDWRTSCGPLGSASAQPGNGFSEQCPGSAYDGRGKHLVAPVMESLSAVQRLPMVGPFVSGGEPR
ncbi:ATP-binding cassette domain-containing protein [Mesorhizobium sp.]